MLAIRFTLAFALCACGSRTLGALECSADSSCDDGNICTEDFCSDGFCAFEPRSDTTPDDGIQCTADMCLDGTAIFTPDDTRCPDQCAGQLCDPELGCVDGQPLEPEDDGDPCTEDICVDESQTVHVLRISDNPCTECVPSGGTTAGYDFVPLAAIDDGDPCTLDACTTDPEDFSQPLLTHVQAKDDGIECTVDSCDPKTGEVTHDAAACP